MKGENICTLCEKEMGNQVSRVSSDVWKKEEIKGIGTVGEEGGNGVSRKGGGKLVQEAGEGRGNELTEGGGELERMGTR